MPDLLAHRGFAAEHPENTVTAVAAAARDGADMVEVDVRASDDGVPVVVHDRTVDRVTDATGAVDSYTAAELRDLDVLHSGVGIPSLADVVESLPASVGLNVELKEPDIVPAVVETVDDIESPLLVSSFDSSALEAMRDHAPSIDRALLVDRRPRAAIETAVALDCTAIHPRDRLCIRSLVVRRAHNAGLTVNVWTVTSRRMANWLTRLGVDGVIADSPSVAQ